MALPIRLPGGYLPAEAIAFAAPGGDATLVSTATPLPVTLPIPAAGAVLSGSSAAPIVAGPFVPQGDRPIWLTLSGSWTGTAQLLRSTDGGATMLPMTLGGETAYRYTAPVNEPIAVETVAGASWHLQLTPGSGTIAYRVQQ